MRRQHATGHATTTATPASVWALVEDITTWTAWAPFEVALLEQPGDPVTGVGAIRRFQRGRITTREEVTEVLPGQRLSYRLLSGLPLSDYEAHIDIEWRYDATHITWSASFVTGIPGTGGIFRRGMAKLYTDYAQRLASAAGTRVSPRSDVPANRSAGRR